jgi:hypothetical protein
MDNRPAIRVKADFYWYCPECGARNDETMVPDTPDLTCQGCGANYKNGSKMEEPEVVVVGDMRHIPVLDGNVLAEKAMQVSTDAIEAFLYVPATEIDHVADIDILVKHSNTREHKELMRKGRREFHKK